MAVVVGVGAFKTVGGVGLFAGARRQGGVRKDRAREAVARGSDQSVNRNRQRRGYLDRNQGQD